VSGHAKQRTLTAVTTARHRLSIIVDGLATELRLLRRDGAPREDGSTYSRILDAHTDAMDTLCAIEALEGNLCAEVLGPRHGVTA
jgi:hypothetical protein